VAKFVFPLEAVLKQRKAAEERKQRAVAVLEAERLMIEDEIRACQRAIEQERDDLRRILHEEQREGGVDLRGARMQASAALRMVAKTHDGVTRLAGVASRIDAARLELIDAMRRRRAIEIMRERLFEEWRQAGNRAESLATDELAVMRAARVRDEDDLGEAA
jgi:flagellar protein FliJ